MTEKDKYRPDIDGLRAIAVVLVLLVHAFPTRFPNGYIGVDVFFVISGFLITGIVVRELDEKRFSIRDFFIRRIIRIYPALMLVLATVVLMGPLVMYAAEYKASLASVWWAAISSANIHYFLSSGYWDTASQTKPLLHLWSLGVEEQFYLFWPLFLIFFHRRKTSLLFVSLAILFVSLPLGLVLLRWNQPAAFYLPFGRVWELAAGGALALVLRENGLAAMSANGQSARLRDLLGIAGLMLLVTMQIVPMEEKMFPGFYAPLVVIAAVLLIFAGKGSWINDRVLSHPAMVYVGKISYPLYLWHWPLLVAARLAGEGQWSASGRNLALVGSIILAIATYHVIERPTALSTWVKSRMAIFLSFLMLALGGAAFAIPSFSKKILPGYNNAPTQAYTPTAINSRGKVALVGDSNAGHLSYGLGLLYGERLITYATPGWPYLDGIYYRPGYVPHVDHKGSPELTKEVLEKIENDRDVGIVILSNAYLMYLPADNLRFGPEPPGSQTVVGAYEEGLVKTIARLRQAGKKVLLVKSIPTYPELPTVTACAEEARPIFRKMPEGCVKPISTVKNDRAQYEVILKRVSERVTGFEYFDTLDVLCDSDFCYVNRDGHLYYIDAGHFTTSGSQLMANAVAGRVEEMLK